MKSFRVVYKMRNPRYPEQVTFLTSWASEIVEARGLVHASKKAQAHLQELGKVAPEKLSIEYIREVDTIENPVCVACMKTGWSTR